MSSILTETHYMDINFLSIEAIEQELSKKFGSVIRWAIVAVENNKVKITVTYENQF